ncbi:hypothetical protein EVAR_48465_1 [Eumeta japonica]|uniref:Uncharacterized protein n=1 Tax=Eumeta variegata TaxID=151549 RepID=A0A4C1XH16_EUMVA|nr:hypothetical protein EVAR_48465_1 [Eumeta japonica]
MCTRYRLRAPIGERPRLIRICYLFGSGVGPARAHASRPAVTHSGHVVRVLFVLVVIPSPTDEGADAARRPRASALAPSGAN